MTSVGVDGAPEESIKGDFTGRTSVVVHITMEESNEVGHLRRDQCRSGWSYGGE